MSTLTIASWNVNGLRASIRSGDFGGWLAASRPDIAGLQEVKAGPGQVDRAAWESEGYSAWWHPAEQPGYSGALLLAKIPPVAVTHGLGLPEFDREGRVIEAEYRGFTLLTAYFPNGGQRGARLGYKRAFFDAFLARVDALRAAGREVVFMGDLNVAHTEEDVARPKEAAKGTGFLPEERAWLDRFVAHGYADSFRVLHPGARDVYTFWEAWRERRARNIGWRIDYVWLSEGLLPRLRRAFVEPSVMGSDHCPVGIEIEVAEAG